MDNINNVFLLKGVFKKAYVPFPSQSVLSTEIIRAPSDAKHKKNKICFSHLNNMINQNFNRIGPQGYRDINTSMNLSLVISA